MLDFIKPVQTKDGRPVEIVITTARGDYPVRGYIGDSTVLFSWLADGRACGASNGNLENVPPPKRYGYVNVYTNGILGSVHKSRGYCDLNASKDRIACIKFEIVEGQFDE